ncbi:MAG: hypothetical protein JSV91_11170, partial [Phycisphaerales bacterium]
MKNAASGQFDSSVLAVVHRAGRVWRLLIADTRRGRPEILDSREVPDRDSEDLDRWLDPHRVGRVICVLPAAAVICRSCTLPDAGPDQLEQALSLQAEAQLLGSAPPHRLAMAVLHAAPGETSRAGIILVWPESALFRPPRTARPMVFAPDVAALAALLNGLRPTVPLLWLDRADGSIAAAITHSNGAAFRAAKEDPKDSEAWRRSVTRALAETALNVGHSDSYVESLIDSIEPALGALRPFESNLLIDSEVRGSAADRLDGATKDAGWWSEYGIAAGALLATTDQLRPLTELKADPPLVRPSRVRATVDKLSRPRTATATVVVCALILAFGPLLISGLRLQLLKWRHSDLDERKANIDQINHQLAMYHTLGDRAWSMTKLMSDIACNTPRGIELEWIRLDHGQPFVIKGNAKKDDEKNREPTEVVGQMQKNLEESGIFDDVRFTWEEPEAFTGTYTFELSSRIVQPHKMRNYPTEQDWQRWTLQQRVNREPPPGDEAVPADTRQPEDTPPVRVADASEGTSPPDVE